MVRNIILYEKIVNDFELNLEDLQLFKKDSTQDMTSGSPLKLILIFAIPIIIGNIFQQLYTIVDTMVVGKALGVKALAALSSVDTINFVCTGIAFGMTQGFGILIAQKYGEKENDELNRIIKNSLVLSVIISGILLILIQLAINPFLTLLRVPGEIRPLSLIYLRILMGGLPIVIMYNMEAVILRSLGDSRSPLVAMVIATLSNIALDLLFVIGLKFGIPGAAVATLIAQVISASYCAIRIKNIEFVNISLSSGSLLDKEWTMPMLKLGLPLAAQNMIIAFGNMILQSIIDGFGVLVIAGSTATNKLYGILDSAALGYGFAMTTYVGQNYGAKNIKRIRKGVLTANVVSVISCVIIASITIGLGKNMLGWFISGTPEEIDVTLNYAYGFLRDMSLFLPTLYLIHVLRSVLQGFGHTVITMASGFVELVIRIIAALTLPALFGPSVLFFAHILAWVGSDIVLIAGYYYFINKEPAT